MKNINLSSLSDIELNDLRSQIANEINLRKFQKLERNKQTISIGSLIKVNHPKTSGKIFRVISMRRTKASIENTTNPREKYTLPITMMELA
jgi:hypothetical protein